MKRIIFFVSILIGSLSPIHFAQAEALVSKVETQDWVVEVYKTDFNRDQQQAKCDEGCSNFHIVTTNKSREKTNVMTLHTYQSEPSASGSGKEGGFFRETKELLKSHEVLTSFTNFPISKEESALEILLVWEDVKTDHFNEFKETIIVPIEHE
ncbi:hypothetical protein [Alkalicoccobacillus gibsonii]|uniref:hypothetical protein n=1 Tax=Alkalicoccobacillus gibsonii TaxID=79881 RepID=UPI0035161D72